MRFISFCPMLVCRSRNSTTDRETIACKEDKSKTNMFLDFRGMHGMTEYCLPFPVCLSFGGRFCGATGSERSRNSVHGCFRS